MKPISYTGIACTLSVLVLMFAGCVTNPYAAPGDVTAPPSSATTLPSGVAYRVLTPGTGDTHPSLQNTIVVNYTGWTTDGRKFDSTLEPDGTSTPASFPLGKLIKGWQEAVPLMVKGEKMRIWIPAALAYGEHPTKVGAPAGMLVFDIELLDIQP